MAGAFESDLLRIESDKCHDVLVTDMGGNEFKVRSSLSS